jgi:formylmethanofuran--tetrahydromethanopterin N-formyltransferase
VKLDRKREALYKFAKRMRDASTHSRFHSFAIRRLRRKSEGAKGMWNNFRTSSVLTRGQSGFGRFAIRRPRLPSGAENSMIFRVGIAYPPQCPIRRNDRVVEIEDTYAEGFRSIYAEVLITARDRKWLDHAANAATGNASSTILCDCEAGIDRYVGPGGDASFETPDGRPGVICQFHVPRFRKDRMEALERSLLVRISQNILTCPSTACFNLIDSDPFFKLGRKISLFGDQFQKRETRFGRRVWTVPIMSGEFVVDRRFGFSDGVMGGNLWFMCNTPDAAIEAADRAAAGANSVAGVVLPFPGGVASSGSRAGSSYKFLVASTNAPFCPTLRDHPQAKTQLPPNVASVQEIIINGRNLETVSAATYAAIDAARTTTGLVKISAGNYNGRLGKSFIHLHRDKQAT